MTPFVVCVVMPVVLFVFTVWRAIVENPKPN